MIRKYFFIVSLLTVSIGSLAEEVQIEIESYQRMAAALGLPDELPHITLFSKDGICILQQTAHLGWSAESIENPEDLSPDTQCEIFLSDGPGATQPSQRDHWTIHLYTLDVPFCKACEHVESQLHELASKYPERFRIKISRVYFSED